MIEVVIPICQEQITLFMRFIPMIFIVCMSSLFSFMMWIMGDKKFSVAFTIFWVVLVSFGIIIEFGLVTFSLVCP